MAQDELGVTVLYEPPVTGSGSADAPQVAFDLIAIHGLNGHPFKTWTHKESKTMWLRDLLPQTISNIRVMTYGYNARFRNFTGHQDLGQISMKLLTELVDLRRTEQEINRPIIFVCHSLGGIVAKKAMLLKVPQEQQKVQSSVYGIIFLGTPHKGSDIANLGKVVADIVRACSIMNPANELLQTLQRDSRVLYEITEEFRPRATSLHIVSFFETKRTNFKIFSRLVVSEDSAILNLPSEVAIGQNADHRDIARFWSIHDRNYRPIMTRLDMFRNDIARQFITPASAKNQEDLHTPYGDPVLFYSPFTPCSTFRGRNRILLQIEDYFREGSKQRKFALCGLGGSGKTQTALKYAVRNRHKYSSGVFFVNADSLTTLESDFVRHHEALQLSNASNKVEGMKQWLGRGEHKEWLLIFDNADDLKAVSVRRYIPIVPWGNVLITSRDQEAIGQLAEEGALLDRLDVEDAIGVLIAKSGIQAPTEREFGEARNIVGLLGCLPLAVDQAGGFIRSRRKTLADYRRLFEERQYEVLKFKSRLAEYEKTVFTAWELNFDQIDRDSKAASNLLLLFCFFDGSSISEQMLQRGTMPQSRWSQEGSIAEVPAKESGISDELIALIQDELAFDAAIEKLLSFSLIQANTDANGSRSFSLHHLVQTCASQRVPEATQMKWRLQAAVLVCHAFPMDELFEIRYGEMGRLMLRHVNHVAEETRRLDDGKNFPIHVKHGLAEMLIEASRFSRAEWKMQVLNQARNLLEADAFSGSYLHARLVLRESSLLRMDGKEADSDAVLEKFIQNSMLKEEEEAKADARWNATRGKLIISYAQNLISSLQLKDANRELTGWFPLDPAAPSTMEKAVLQARNVNLGKMLRYEGKFQEALGYLEEQFRESESDENLGMGGWRHVLMSHVADLYCELDRPAEAAALLEAELRQLAFLGNEDRGSGKRLQFAFADSLIKLGRYDEAEERLLRLERVLDSRPDPKKIARRRNFRILTNLARIAHWRGAWTDALAHWNEALEALEVDGAAQSSSAGVVRYSMAYALLKLRNPVEARSNFDTGSINIASERRTYWIPLHSYWRDYIVRTVEQELAVWTVHRSPP